MVLYKARYAQCSAAHNTEIDLFFLDTKKLFLNSSCSNLNIIRLSSSSISTVSRTNCSSNCIDDGQLIRLKYKNIINITIKNEIEFKHFCCFFAYPIDSLGSVAISLVFQM